jgi:NAD(P)-dependent dehydrogenase (short-subunit alcohol dehydrogenase family)
VYADRIRLDGRTALVIGAGRGGMGTYTSLVLAEAGATIVAVDLTDELVTETREQVEALGAQSYGVTADVRDMAQVEEAVASAIRQAGRIDCLANVAGGMQVGQWQPVVDTPDDVYEAVMNLNFRYVFVACRAVGRHMIEERIDGRIVSYSSVSALASAPYHAVYGAAKAAVISLTHTMALEWGKHGIRVNAVAPGGVNTPRPRSGDRGDPEEFARGWNPLGRRIPPDEVPAAVLFLLSDLSGMITGQTIVVDAGVTARTPLGPIERFARME